MEDPIRTRRAGGFLLSDYEREHAQTETSVWSCGLAHDPEHSLLLYRDGVRVLTIGIPEVWGKRLRDAGAWEWRPSRDEHGTLAWLSRRIYGELDTWSAGSVLIVQGLVLEMLSALVKSSSLHSTEPRWIRRVDEMIRVDFARHLTVGGLAAGVGVHPVHLSRTWRRLRGQSIGDSIHRARVDAACRRIAAGAACLADVALEVGFADQTHFSRVFKRVTGMTPGVFRATSLDGRERNDTLQARGEAPLVLPSFQQVSFSQELARF